MKNVIKYFYKLDVDSIRQKGNDYFLLINNENYMFVKVDEKINEEYLYTYINYYSHEIIYNNKDEIVTSINDLNYILIKIKCVNKKITIVDIEHFNNNSYVNQQHNLEMDWASLWSNKVDYLEYQMSQVGKKYPIIRESFSYFVGLTETAIQFYNVIKKEKVSMYICHKRLGWDSSLIDLYNPINYVTDTRVRDGSEYFKSVFFYNSDSKLLEDIKKYITSLSKIELLYFFDRMLFPSYYYDLYDEIINNNENENKISVVIEKINEYEKLIQNIFLEVRNIIPTDNIEWIIKNIG